MFENNAVQRDFSDAAERYDAHAVLQQHVLSALLGKALALLPRHAQLLDAGCGTGRLAGQVADYHVTQIDIAYGMCREAAKNAAPVVNGTLASLPFADATFNGVISSLVLQWVPNWQAAIDEMQRVLKPGGLLAFSTFGEETLKELRESFASVDGYPHVSSFLPRTQDIEIERRTEYYPDLFSLMRRLKMIGARNKLSGRRKSLMTRRQMQRVEQYYRTRYGTPSGLPVTWEILYFVKAKP